MIARLIAGGTLIRDFWLRFSTWIQCWIVFLVSLVVLWPIIPSAFSADDTYDSFVPYQLKYSHQTTWTFIESVTESWKLNQGRFFPGAIALGTYAHYFFPERAGYKALQLFVALLALAMSYGFVRILTKNHSVGLFSVLVVLCSTQIHVQYDAVLQFSLQQPSLMSMFFSSLICFVLGVRKTNWILLALSAVLYLCTMLTYETTALLWPIFPLVLINEAPKFWKAKLIGSMVAPTVIVLNLVYLRSNVTATAPGYTSSFSIGPLTETLAKQMIASIPMSYSELRTPSFILPFPQHFLFGVGYWWLAVLGAGVVTYSVLRDFELPTFKTRLLMMGIGLVLWVAPAFVVAQTVRWQAEVVLGNGYITIYQGYFGFALVITAIYLELISRIRNRKSFLSTSIITLVALLVMVSISSVVTNNRRAVAQYDAGSLWPREHFERAISNGVFDRVPSDSTVFTPEGEWWFNAPFIEWYGGPHLKNVIAARDEVNYPSCMNSLDTCMDRLAISHSFFTYGRFLNEPRVTIVGTVQKMTGSNGVIKGIRINKANVYIDYPSPSPNVEESEIRCMSWLANRIGSLGVEIQKSDIEVKVATRDHCLALLPASISFNPRLFTP